MNYHFGIMFYFSRWLKQIQVYSKIHFLDMWHSCPGRKRGQQEFRKECSGKKNRLLTEEPQLAKPVATWFPMARWRRPKVPKSLFEWSVFVVWNYSWPWHTLTDSICSSYLLFLDFDLKVESPRNRRKSIDFDGAGVVKGHSAGDGTAATGLRGPGPKKDRREVWGHRASHKMFEIM